MSTNNTNNTNNTKQIIVKVKTVYGNDLIYPYCDTSKIFAKMLCTKTLSYQSVQCIKELGYSVQVKSQFETL